MWRRVGMGRLVHRRTDDDMTHLKRQKSRTSTTDAILNALTMEKKQYTHTEGAGAGALDSAKPSLIRTLHPKVRPCVQVRQRILQGERRSNEIKAVAKGRGEPSHTQAERRASVSDARFAASERYCSGGGVRLRQRRC